MITWSFVGVLFWFLFIPFKAYFLWVNYKARFRYGLREHSPFWRRLDQKIGIGSIVVDFVLSMLVIVSLSAVLTLLLDISEEIALSLVLFGAIGWTFVNMAADKISVEKFEQNCLLCKNKERCMRFLEQNCTVEAFKRRARSAVRYTKA